jgi:hypothetical protein
MTSFNTLRKLALNVYLEIGPKKALPFLRFASDVTKMSRPFLLRKNLDYGEGWAGTVEEIKQRRLKYLKKRRDQFIIDNADVTNVKETKDTKLSVASQNSVSVFLSFVEKDLF